MALQVLVGSFAMRPRDLPEMFAGEIYRRGEALAFGIDMALQAHGVRRTDFLDQAHNRRVFEEDLSLPVGWDEFAARVLALEGIAVPEPFDLEARRDIAAGRIGSRFPHLLGHADAPWYFVPRDFAKPIWLPEPRPQVGPGVKATEPRDISLGSAARLGAEIQQLDELLRRHGYDTDLWLPGVLLEAADRSLETGLAVIVSEG